MARRKKKKTRHIQLMVLPPKRELQHGFGSQTLKGVFWLLNGQLLVQLNNYFDKRNNGLIDTCLLSMLLVVSCFSEEGNIKKQSPK